MLDVAKSKHYYDKNSYIGFWDLVRKLSNFLCNGIEFSMSV